MLIVIGVIFLFVLYVCGGEVLFYGYNKIVVMLVVSVIVLVGLVVFIYKDCKKK